MRSDSTVDQPFYFRIFEYYRYYLLFVYLIYYVHNISSHLFKINSHLKLAFSFFFEKRIALKIKDNEVVDVTRRYTARWSEVLQRRAAIVIACQSQTFDPRRCRRSGSHQPFWRLMNLLKRIYLPQLQVPQATPPPPH
jgi:hypothetical protein